MNYGYVRFILGRILLLETALLIPSLLISLIDKEDSRILLALALSMGVTLMLGILLSFRAPLQTTFYAREGFVIVALAWIALSLFGALPFVISGAIPSMIDAFFEMASGFTTTGASILTNVEAMPRSLLFWRSLTHLIGGMGVLVCSGHYASVGSCGAYYESRGAGAGIWQITGQSQQFGQSSLCHLSPYDRGAGHLAGCRRDALV